MDKNELTFREGDRIEYKMFSGGPIRRAIVLSITAMEWRRGGRVELVARLLVQPDPWPNGTEEAKRWIHAENARRI